MPFDSSGTFTRLRGPDSWKGDATAGTKIKSDLHDSNDNDLAAGLSECLTKTGKSQPSANLPMNGMKITNLGAPTNDTDAATKAYADLPKPFSTGATISGADVNGRLTFSSPTGANGLSFTGADLSWLARLAGAPAGSLNRLALNNKPDGSGTDVVTFDEAGNGNIAGTLGAAGNLIATSVSAVKAAAGNIHFWFYGPNNEDRGLIYTTAGAPGAMNLRTSSGHGYTFGNEGIFTAPSHLRAATALYGTDGNISGSIWTNWGAGDAYNAISARIEARAQAFANDRVAGLQYRKVSEGSSGGTLDFRCPSGAVVTGYRRDGGSAGQVYNLYYMYLQVYDVVRGWVGFSG